jgi:beta-lactamase class A
MRISQWAVVVLTCLGFSALTAPPAAAPPAEPATGVNPAPALPPPDPELQRGLESALQRVGLSRAVAERRAAVSLMDVSDPSHPRYAAVNDDEMIYAASLPKIAILLAGFERIHEGLMRDSPAVREMFTRLIRYSSNEDASKAVQMIGFEYIARTLRSSKYLLYDPGRNGGLWIGKAYGGLNDRWRRDPLHNLSHGATSAQAARFFWMLETGRLVSPEFSAEMKEILSKPGIRHKFVKGLSGTPGREIYRKSGTWRDWHADAALIEAGDKKYIAVALMEDPRGGEAMPQMIVEFDRLICGEASRGRLAQTD